MVLKRLKIGLIGWGPYGENLARVALNTLRAEIPLVWTRSKGTAEKIVAAGFNPTNDVDELINSPEVEAVIVASPNSLHKEHVLKVCAAKKALWAEKPLVLNLADYDEIINAIKDSGILTHLNFSKRNGPVYRKMKELKENGSLGEIMHIVKVDRRGTGLYNLGSPHKAVTNPDLSGGWLIHHMCHQVDFVTALSGQKIKKVYCRTVKSSPECPSEESIAAILTAENGSVFELSDGVGPQSENYVSVLGSNGLAKNTQGTTINYRGFDKENKAFYGQGGNSVLFTPEGYGDDSMQAFTAAVLGMEPDTNYPVEVIPVEKGRHVLEVLLAMRESAESGNPVEF
ncbi:MAG: Gfo/Idh/MocA family protein [Fibrobacterota bacterium]